jgi:broad specificity phosphatase PhoE
MRRLALLLLLAAAIGCGAKSEAPTTVLIVRHAEKMANAGTDADLSPAGVARANALAAVVAHAGAEAAYVTQYRRTKETAAPLHLPMIEVPVDLAAPGDYPKRLAETILSRSAGKVVLVVSHSNVVPALIEALGQVRVPPLGDAEYGRLYVITVPRSGAPRVIAAQYGQ